MEVRFDVYFKKNLGTLFKSNEVDLNGKYAHVNIPLALVDRMEVNYLIGGNKEYTDDVEVVRAAGFKVNTIENLQPNIKLTVPEDLLYLKFLLQLQELHQLK